MLLGSWTRVKEANRFTELPWTTVPQDRAIDWIRTRIEIVSTLSRGLTIRSAGARLSVDLFEAYCAHSAASRVRYRLCQTLLESLV